MPGAQPAPAPSLVSAAPQVSGDGLPIGGGPTKTPEVPNPAAPSTRLDLVQVLRALAASMVVVGHLLGRVRLHPDLFGTLPPLYYAGGTGVDIFFVISGFIMVKSSGRLMGTWSGPAKFLRRRLARIVPLYWGVTALTIMLMLLAHKPPPSATAIVTSLGFFPYDALGIKDGWSFPIVDLGWTLNYEMMFYVVFALFIPLGRGRCVAAVSLVLAAIVTLGLIVHPVAAAPRFWSQPIVLEFVAGMLMAWWSAHAAPNWPVAWRCALAVVAIALYLADPLGVMHEVHSLPGALRAVTPNDMARAIGWGLPCAMLVLAAVAGPSTLRSRVGRAVVLVGDSSYALYLVHPFVLVTGLRVAQRMGEPGPMKMIAFVAIVFVMAVIASVACFRLVERPLNRLLIAPGRPSLRMAMPETQV